MTTFYDHCIQLDLPFNLALIIPMELAQFYNIFSIQQLLDRDFSDQRLRLGGTVYLVHCLTAHVLINCDKFYMYVYRIVCFMYIVVLCIICRCMLLYCVYVVHNSALVQHSKEMI